FQRARIIGGGPRPRDTHSLGPTDLLGDRRPTPTAAVSDLAITEPLVPRAPQPRVDLTPGSPLGRPLLLPHAVRNAPETARVSPASHGVPSSRKGGELCRGSCGSVRLASVAGLSGHPWPRSCGTGGRFA